MSGLQVDLELAGVHGISEQLISCMQQVLTADAHSSMGGGLLLLHGPAGCGACAAFVAFTACNW